MSTYAESERTTPSAAHGRVPVWSIHLPDYGHPDADGIRLYVRDDLTLAEADMLATSIRMYIHEAQEDE